MSDRPVSERPFSRGGTAIVFAVDDDVWDEMQDLPTEVDGRPILVMRSSELGDPDVEADFHFGRYVRTTPSCRKILTFAEKPKDAPPRFTVIEQDSATGTIYRGGQMVWAGAPVEVWNPDDDTPELAPLRDGVLVFKDGPRTRVTLLPNVAVVYEQPRTRPLRRGERVPPDWKERALGALESRSRGTNPGTDPGKDEERPASGSQDALLGWRTSSRN